MYYQRVLTEIEKLGYDAHVVISKEMIKVNVSSQNQTLGADLLNVMDILGFEYLKTCLINNWVWQIFVDKGNGIDD